MHKKFDLLYLIKHPEGAIAAKEVIEKEDVCTALNAVVAADV